MTSEPQTVLVVEDDGDLRRLIREALAAAGLRVLEAESGGMGLSLLRSRKPDLVLLDVKLPDGSGLDVCAKIRQGHSGPSTPVIMLTAEAEFEKKAAGFAAGADQYLVKPVKPQEVVLWVQALLRRLSYDTEEGDVLAAGDLSLDLKSRLVRVGGAVISTLTVKEFDLLYFLVKKRPQVVSRKQVLSNLWHTITVDHVVDTHISNLRRKLPPEVSDRIQNVPGKGFRYFA